MLKIKCTTISDSFVFSSFFLGGGGWSTQSNTVLLSIVVMLPLLQVCKIDVMLYVSYQHDVNKVISYLYF